MQKKSYQPPKLECFGAISNFTTGGSGKKSEYKWKKVKSMGMGMGDDEYECVHDSNSKNKNTIRC